MHCGRIECYVHSDNTTENKGAALIKVTTDTDFGAQTAIFKEFTQQAAKYAFAVFGRARVFVGGPTTWEQIIQQYPHLEPIREAAERELKECVKVVEVVILKL